MHSWKSCDDALAYDLRLLVGVVLRRPKYGSLILKNTDVLITTKKCYFVDLIIMVLSTFE